MPACHAGGHEFESRTHRKVSETNESLRVTKRVYQITTYVMHPLFFVGGKSFSAAPHHHGVYAERMVDGSTAEGMLRCISSRFVLNSCFMAWGSPFRLFF